MEPTTTLEQDRAAAGEAALVARLGAGDRGEPLAALYDLYARRVYGLGLNALGDAGLAEELVQDTFVRLWRSAARYDPARASVRTWVFTLARRAAIDLHRHRSARPLPAALDESHAAAGGDAFEQLIVGLDVRAALDTLSPKHREVLELHVLADLTQAEIGRRLGVPLGTVKTRTFHALRALRAELEGRDLLG